MSFIEVDPIVIGISKTMGVGIRSHPNLRANLFGLLEILAYVVDEIQPYDQIGAVFDENPHKYIKLISIFRLFIHPMISKFAVSNERNSGWYLRRFLKNVRNFLV